MKKEDLISLGISDEQAEKILTLHTNSVKDFIPKARFDEVNTAKNELKTQIDGLNKQITELGKLAPENESLKTKVTEITEAQKKIASDYKQKIQDVRSEAVIAASKAKNSKAVRAVIDWEKVTWDDDGNPKGLSEQIEDFKKGDNAFLFEQETKPATPAAPVVPVFRGAAQVTSHGTQQQLPATTYESIKAAQEAAGKK